MFPFKSRSRSFHLLSGQSSMEMTVLLLLTVPLVMASPLRPALRQEDSYITDQDQQRLEVKRSTDGQDADVPELKVIPIQTMDDLIESRGVKTRPKRAPKRGCQLGTCQLHNLADTLFQMSKTSGKDQSKNAHDPQGYGR